MFDKPYVSKTAEGINELALGLVQGKFFHSSAIEDPAMIPRVFLPLNFNTQKASISLLFTEGDITALPISPSVAEWIKDNEIKGFYASMDMQTPRGINGYPQFSSVSFLNKQDNDALMRRLGELEAAMRINPHAQSIPT